MKSRRSQVNLEATTLYHCMARCVRRAFLCGDDQYSGQNYDHRKEWIRDRMRFLATIFAIEVCAYAILSNHLHVLVNVALAKAKAWSVDEVVERYCKLHKCGKEQWENAKTKEQREALVKRWRSRLTSISWFMGQLDEYIARKANEEDGVSGRFWEGRFKSQAIVDEKGLIACMAYVDLNPVRAGMANSLDGSDFTSIQERLQAVANASEEHDAHVGAQECPESPMAGLNSSILVPFADQVREGYEGFTLPIAFADYVAFVEWTGRELVPEKRGSITGPPPAMLQSLGMEPEQWLDILQSGQLSQATALGEPHALTRLADKLSQKWVQGKSVAQRLWRSPSSVAPRVSMA